MTEHGDVPADLPASAADPTFGPTPLATIFVSDPSAEAAKLAQQLRSAGYVVVDVPLSLLPGRAAVQTPSVVVMDGDLADVGDAITSVRQTPGGEGIHIVLLGVRPEGTVAPSGLDLCRWFVRPVDVPALVTTIHEMTGGPSVPPPSPSRGAAVSSARPPSSGSRQDQPASSRAERSAISLQTTLSPELEALLADAEKRVRSAPLSIPPSPEEEIEAVLPAAFLAALDEPLEDDDEESIAEPPRSRADQEAHREDTGTHTSTGRRAGAVASAVAPTMPPAVLQPGIEADEVPSSEAEPASRRPARSTAPVLLSDAGGVIRELAGAVAARRTGCFAFESSAGVRRVVLRDGDVVTAASSLDDETLVAFLSGRGDLRKDQVKELGGKLPPFGRHAGAALVGHGLLRQDQLWTTLRAHAEWILGRTLREPRATLHVEPDAPGRLRQEPSVFGGSSGAEVVVEVVRRVVGPEEATHRLGGAGAIVADGPTALLGECALDAATRSIVEECRGESIEELARRSEAVDLSVVLYALSQLGVVTVTSSLVAHHSRAPGTTSEGVADLDLAAVRERVRARSELVSEADYFTLLGVSRDATGYEVRRAYLELRHAFEPSRVLTPELADLEDDLTTIVVVLEEAYDILRDSARRERYRRALGE